MKHIVYHSGDRISDQATVKIVDFIDSLSERPVVSAFTATATSEVKTDIECILKLERS